MLEQPSVNAVSSVSQVPAHGVERAPDQRRDVGAAPRDGAEHLPAALGRLDVADAHLQVPFALVAAPDERGSKLRAIAGAAAVAATSGLTAAASRSRSPSLSVWLRRVSWLVPAATGSKWASTPAATR